MARSRRRAGRTLKRPATAFAGGKLRDGQTMGWESIYDDPVPDNFGNQYPVDVRTVGGNNIRAVALIPESVTRGTVTMLRVRGTIFTYFLSIELAVAFINWPVHYQIQLVPVQDGAFDPTSILTPSNGADQESNRIVWQRKEMPRAGTTITGPGAEELHEGSCVSMEVDVKVKRRWDRANWALMLVAEVESGSVLQHITGGYLRGLFATSDGV